MVHFIHFAVLTYSHSCVSVSVQRQSQKPLSLINMRVDVNTGGHHQCRTGTKLRTETEYTSKKTDNSKTLRNETPLFEWHFYAL